MSASAAFAVDIILPGAPAKEPAAVTICQAIGSIDGYKKAWMVIPGGAGSNITNDLGPRNSNVKVYLCAYNSNGQLVAQARISATYTGKGIKYSKTGDGIPFNWSGVTFSNGKIAVDGVAAAGRTAINATGVCSAWPTAGNPLKNKCAW